MKNPWFETVAEAERRAQKRLPRSVYSALRAGSEGGITVSDNVDAFVEIGLAPRTADMFASRDLTTTVMDQELALPVLISPTGVQAVHPDGELAVARAAAAGGTAMCLSSFASKPVEEIVAANPRTFFQIYWSGTREQILARLERARAAGCVGLIVTLDWSFSMGRDWGSPHIPERLTVREALRFAPEALTRPRWLKAFAIPDLTAPNMAELGAPAPTFFAAYAEWRRTPPPTWSDVAWLREQWPRPLLIKGITRIDEARHAVDAGATAISVSNHGGNNLDGTPATIRLLPGIADAVGRDVEVLMDGECDAAATLSRLSPWEQRQCSSDARARGGSRRMARRGRKRPRCSSLWTRFGCSRSRAQLGTSALAVGRRRCAGFRATPWAAHPGVSKRAGEQY